MRALCLKSVSDAQRTNSDTTLEDADRNAANRFIDLARLKSFSLCPNWVDVCMRCSVCLVMPRKVAQRMFDMASFSTQLCVLIGSYKSSIYLAFSR